MNKGGVKMEQEKKYIEIIRLTPEQYEVLEKKVSRLGINNQTTPLEVAYNLGVQAVLKELRVGYVIGTFKRT